MLLINDPHHKYSMANSYSSIGSSSNTGGLGQQGTLGGVKLCETYSNSKFSISVILVIIVATMIAWESSS